MFRKYKFFTFLFISFFFIILFQSEVFAQRLIVVSGYPLSSLAKELFSQDRLYFLLPPKGDFHHYELTPKDWLKIKEADLVILVGTEPWSKKVFQLKTKKVYSLGKPEEKLSDPHLWFSLERVENLLLALKEAVETPKVEALLKEIAEIRKEKAKLAQCENKKFYHLGHQVFFFFLYRTPIKEVPLISGHYHGEISPKRMQEFTNVLQKNRVKRILLSSTEFSKYADYLQRKGFEVVRAYSGDEEIPFRYKNFLEINLKAIKKALECEE